MYAFPNIKLPEKFIKEANAKGLVPDAYYCSLLLEETGICVVPGSGFRQKVGLTQFFKLHFKIKIDKLYFFEIIKQIFNSARHVALPNDNPAT